MQSLWLIIIVFFLILLIVPIFSKVYVYFDFLNDSGNVSVYLFCFKMLNYKIKFEDYRLIVYTSKDQKDVELQVSKKQMRFLKQMSIQLKEKVVLKNIKIFFRIGLNDAFNTALVSGTITSLISAIFGYIKNTKQTAKISIFSEPNFVDKNFITELKIDLFITTFDVLYAIIMSFLIIKRSEKYERV